MNKMSPPPPKESSGISEQEDRLGMIAIPEAELQRLYAERAAENARLARRERVKRLTGAGTVLFLLGVCGAQAAAICTMLPLKELVPMVVPVRADGTWQNVVQWKDLPEQVQNDTVVNTAWSYVVGRESWSESEAQHNWELVSTMSAPKVREAFQAWYKADNKASPAQVFKDGTTVSIRYVAWEGICPLSGCDGPPPAYRFRFDRIETPPGGLPGKPVRYAATVKLRRNVPLPNDKQWQRWTENPALIQVTEYPGAVIEGVAK